MSKEEEVEAIAEDPASGRVKR